MVAKCHEKVANARADFQHKRSRTLIDENSGDSRDIKISQYNEKPKTGETPS